MQRPSGPAALAGDLQQHRKPDTAHDDAERDRQADDGVADEAHQVVVVERHPRVVERCHRVERARPQRPAERLDAAPPQACRQHQRQQHFDEEGDDGDGRHQGAHLAGRERADLVLRNHPLTQPQPLRHHEDEHRTDGHDAEPTDLHQHQQDDLTERRPVTGCDVREPGDRDRRGGGEQAAHEARVRVGVRDGQREQRGTQEDEPDERSDDQPSGVRAAP